MEVVCCLQLADSQVVAHLAPIAGHPAVDRIWIVRSHVPSGRPVPKASYVLTPARWKPLRGLQMLWHCLRLSRRQEVKLFVSFNPIPYGLIAAAAAFLAGKPFHLGFIGSDWDRDMRSRWGRWLLPVVRRAMLVSATGSRMRREMLRQGIPADTVVTLPHTVDAEQFPVIPAGDKRYDAAYIGRLIPLKRVDIILRAFRRVLATRPAARLAIVGDGPQRPELEHLAAELGIAAQVDFCGYVENVRPYLAATKSLVLASSREGLPYVIIEAMCSGVVPVSAPVGDIPDLLRDGHNGLLHTGDEADLADCLCRLLDDDGVYRHLRANAIAARPRLRHEAATEVWAPWLAAWLPHRGAPLSQRPART